MSKEKNASGEHVPCISLLAPAWDKPIPPQAVRIVKLFDSISGFRGTRPEWNSEWLIGLEQFVRAIVRDELSRDNAHIRGGTPSAPNDCSSMRYGAECPSCGRDNSEYGNVCTSEECPANAENQDLTR